MNMANERSLEGIANHESKLKKLLELARNEANLCLDDVKSLVYQVKNEAKSLPYEIPASLLGYTGGTKLGEQISRMFPVPHDSLLHDLGQRLQDKDFGYIGAVVLAVLASAITRHYGQRIRDYVQRSDNGNRNA